MNKNLYVFIMLCAWIVSAPLQTSAKTPKKKGKPYTLSEELNLLHRLDKLPLYRTGCLVEQISSYDTTGGNDDGFSGKYSYLRKEGNQLVLADLTGPGVINRIWTPTPTGDTLSFYFDGEKNPRLKISFNDLFSGKVYPFIKPICGNEIGGFYCYLPIPYEKSCKITFSGEKIMFHQIQYRNLPGYKVTSFTPRLNDEEKKILTDAATRWANLSPSVTDYASGNSAGYEMKEQTFTLLPGQEVPFFQQEKGGRIVGFEIDGGNSFEGLYKDVLLVARWDNDPVNAIYAPLADFFGYAYGKTAMRSMLIGKKQDINYCYIPFPFDLKATMKLQYKPRPGKKQNPVQVHTKVYYNTIARNPGSEGKFYSTWHREINPPEGKYYPFASLQGKGHYIGTVHQAQGLKAEMTLFFEGDDSTYVDGKMRIHGTGSEDYYNGGWYALLDRWDRGVSLPIHGSLDYSLPMSRTGAYRFYLTDKMPYEQELFIGIEHGPEGNKYPVDYTSVAYYYSDCAPRTCMEPTEELRTVYIPREHVFYPQLMQLTLSGGAKVVHDRGIRIQTEGENYVRILLENVPEGRYKLYLSYFDKPQGADFCVWQRQKQISGWKPTRAEKETRHDKVYIGEMELTPQTNSLSIHARRNGDAKEFEFDLIRLEKID
ncbi:glycoside hydrolase family 172 protein [Parabacteroides pacaensis]|uniref:glycoside hydrolase family 172 protein n=1 Tax=Parabacteroides pacaensis TaxID=2086575 RepID=UPI000D10DFB4|nr:glycoside hydrolase family 172 protein [Parabacteroides pacaensis]